MHTDGIDKLIPELTTFGGNRETPTLRNCSEWGSYPLGYVTRGGDVMCADCATEQINEVLAGVTEPDPGDILTGDVIPYEAAPEDIPQCCKCWQELSPTND